LPLSKKHPREPARVKFLLDAGRAADKLIDRRTKDVRIKGFIHNAESNMYAIVIESRSGIAGPNAKRPGEAYHVIQMLAQEEDGGAVGILKHFAGPADGLENVRVGDVLEIEVAENKRGMNSYVDVVSAKPSDKTAEINYV